MNAVIYKTVKPSNNERNFYTLSDVDLKNLKYYLNEQSRSIPDLTHLGRTDDDDIAIDLYVNKILADVSEPIPYDYQYHHHHHHQPHQELSMQSLPVDYYNTFSLEIATCGMPKNTRLPIPYENFSLTSGIFGDDAGFTMQLEQQNFLGKFTK